MSSNKPSIIKSYSWPVHWIPNHSELSINHYQAQSRSVKFPTMAQPSIQQSWWVQQIPAHDSSTIHQSHTRSGFVNFSFMVRSFSYQSHTYDGSDKFLLMIRPSFICIHILAIIRQSNMYAQTNIRQSFNNLTIKYLSWQGHHKFNMHTSCPKGQQIHQPFTYNSLEAKYKINQMTNRCRVCAAKLKAI